MPLNQKDVNSMMKLGWEFMPTGPEEWEWVKFDKDGSIIARQGDGDWAEDLSK